MLKIGVITMALMSFLHAGWLGDLFDNTPKPPIAVPIDMSKAGNTAEIVIRSDDSDKTRYFSLYFVMGVPGQYQITSKDWLEKFVGHGSIEGTRTPVMLIIYSLEKDKESILFLNKTIEAGGTDSRGFKLNGQNIIYANRWIDAIKLPQGKYHIKLENLQDFPELKEIEIYFAIHGGRGKY
ncbi:MAG: DUF5625 family protein [Sulfurimonas sp.]|uniref:DUF5625 family protein n=1 Tax=Sulfurimonas sp. TaxID=2022749 RepID=UPI003D143EAE